MLFPSWYIKLLISNNHIFLAGSTGSGKSVLINGLICRALCEDNGIVLIDPKQVELYGYRNNSHVMAYTSDINGCIRVLNQCIKLMYTRLKKMQKKGLKTSDEKPVYIFFDECMDYFENKTIVKQVKLLAQLARCTNIFIICATQKVAGVIPTFIRCNFAVKIALRTNSKLESKAILDQPGAEELPVYGECLLRIPSEKDIQHLSIKYYSDNEINDFLKLAR